MTADIRKAVVVVVFVLCVTLLSAIGKVNAEIAISSMTFMCGYIVGNGYNALKNNPPSAPVIYPKGYARVPQEATPTNEEGPNNVVP